MLTEQQRQFVEKIASLKDFDETFELVKAVVVNTYLLTILKKTVKSTEEYNSYLFMVLAHEYLHSLGIVDENAVRQMTFELCKWMLGNDHTATKMAKEGPSAIYPELRSMVQSQFGRDFQVVRNFDKTNQTYIQ